MNYAVPEDKCIVLRTLNEMEKTETIVRGKVEKTEIEIGVLST
jgi:hypothetical protein